MKINGYTISVTPMDAYMYHRPYWWDETTGEEREPTQAEVDDDKIYHESLKGKIHLYILIRDSDNVNARMKPLEEKLETMAVEWDDLPSSINRTVVTYNLKQIALKSPNFCPANPEEYAVAIKATFKAISLAMESHALQEWDLSGIVEQ